MYINAVLGNILLFFFYLLLCFVCLEIIVRIYIERFATDSMFLKYASFNQLKKRFVKTRMAPHRYIGFIPAPNYKREENRHNSLGYRGDEIEAPKPKNTFRIVCIGGSTTYTAALKDYRLSYPHLLNEELKQRGYDNIDVVNAGCGSWSSWESLVNFEFRALDLDPDLIIIYHGINDIHPRLVWPPEAYKGDNSGTQAPLVSQVFMPSILEHSTLLRTAMIKLRLAEPHLCMSRTMTKGSSTYYGKVFYEQMRNKSYPSGIFKDIPAKQMLAVNKPVYFRRNIENIIAIAKSRKIDVMLVTFAYSLQFSKAPRVSSDEYISAYEETNNLLKEIAGEKDVNLFDFATIFPKDRVYYLDGRHMSEEGVHLKAKLFAEYIIENNIISKSPSKKNEGY